MLALCYIFCVSVKVSYTFITYGFSCCLGENAQKTEQSSYYYSIVIAGNCVRARKLTQTKLVICTSRNEARKQKQHEKNHQNIDTKTSRI